MSANNPKIQEEQVKQIIIDLTKGRIHMTQMTQDPTKRDIDDEDKEIISKLIEKQNINFAQ